MSIYRILAALIMICFFALGLIAVVGGVIWLFIKDKYLTQESE